MVQKDAAVSGRTGLWLIGARGSVATTVACGLAALKAGLIDPVGCVTEGLALNPGVFPGWPDLVLGGHDLTTTGLDKRAEALAEAGVVPPGVLSGIRDDLLAVDARIRPGYHPALHQGAQAVAAARLSADLDDFRRAEGLERVVVINVASTEAPVPTVPEHQNLAALREALDDPGRCVLPPSSLAAYAAFTSGCPFVDFTPSPGIRIPALVELANEKGLPFAGSDGKTGQTLLRSVLAPMFVARRLKVASWSGTNLLGGGDGATLGDGTRAEGKLRSKARGLEAMLGAAITAPLHIDNVPDLGERKVAWDYVSFEGFLGARMSLQLSWDGYDSALAAPLVLDLARLVAGAQATGATGPLGALGFFFKDGPGTGPSGPHGLADQAAQLLAWIRGLERQHADQVEKTQ